MNQQAILQSNLLDIIFENRNKDYGAYILRKSYQKRLIASMLLTFSGVVVLSLFLSYGGYPPVAVIKFHESPAPETTISRLHKTLSPGKKKMMTQKSPEKKIQARLPEAERPPRVTPSDNINKLPATPADFQSSLSRIDSSGLKKVNGARPGGEQIPGGNNPGNSAKLLQPANRLPLETADIMPEYPGGIPALLAFLKKNIHSPADVQEEEDVTVRIEFVVNYDGNLENFLVLKSGGTVFDQEVIRVLKKMPPWIPGKSNGEKVAVYYTVPVKFANDAEK